MIKCVSLKRNLSFVKRDNKGAAIDKVFAKKNVFTTLPDWVVQDNLYKLAVASKELSVSEEIISPVEVALPKEEKTAKKEKSVKAE